MASSSRSANSPRGQKTVSVMILLVAFYTLASAESAMADGTSSVKTTLQTRLVQALKEKGGFSAAATFLGAVELSRVLPDSSTILVPMDEEVTESGLQVSTFNTALPILQYHVITKRFAFSDLQQLPEGERLETLLANNTIIITSNSSSNFSVDDVPLSHGNLFLASSMAVHGIKGVLNFAIYGQPRSPPNYKSSAPPASVSPATPDAGESGKPATPPSAGKGSSSRDNGTQSSPSHANSPGLSINSSFSPPDTTATGIPAISPFSPSVPVSLPSSFAPPPRLPSSSSTEINPKKEPLPPAFSSQQAGQPGILPTNCDGNSLQCSLSSSSSQDLKPGLAKDVLCVLAGVLLANGPATLRLPLTLSAVTSVILAAVPTAGEMNADVSKVLRNKGGFRYAATYLQALDMHKVLPNSSTVLVPTDLAIEATGLIYNTLGAALPTLKYHVVTKQLSFEDLQNLPVGTMLATLLPRSSLLITNNAASNFTVNDVLLSHPDIYRSGGTTVHGIAGVMNFSHVNSSAADLSLPHLRPMPLPPGLILPLPESAEPFAAPFPVSHAVSELKSTFVIRLTLLVCFTGAKLLVPTPHAVRSHYPVIG